MWRRRSSASSWAAPQSQPERSRRELLKRGNREAGKPGRIIPQPQKKGDGVMAVLTKPLMKCVRAENGRHCPRGSERLDERMTMLGFNALHDTEIAIGGEALSHCLLGLG